MVVWVMRDTSWIGWSTPVYPRTKPSRFSNSQSTKRSHPNDTKTDRRESHLEKLVDALPKGIEQRTPEWYAAREGLITASNFHKAAAKPEQFIRDKLKDKPFLGSDATRWGVKYEDVALLYSHYNYTRVIEYGLLHHPTIAHLGASPTVSHHTGSWSKWSPYSKTLKDIPKNIGTNAGTTLHADSMNVTSSFVAWGLAQAECENMMDTTDVAVLGRLHHSMMDLSNFLARVTLSRSW
jgi:hypothetical protein